MVRPTERERISRLREAWTTKIRAEDYDFHMASVGQAQANAQLITDWLSSNAPKRNSSVLFAGAGTGQVFDYLPTRILSPYIVTFTDINSDYLKRLESRLKSQGRLRFRIIMDDIERSKLSAEFASAVAVLLLEHVEWHLAVATLCKLSTDSVFVVVQENPPEMARAVSDGQPLAGTMAIFREIQPALLSRRELVKEFDRYNFSLVRSREATVLYGKKMVGLGFAKNASDSKREKHE